MSSAARRNSPGSASSGGNKADVSSSTPNALASLTSRSVPIADRTPELEYEPIDDLGRELAQRLSRDPFHVRRPGLTGPEQWFSCASECLVQLVDLGLQCFCGHDCCYSDDVLCFPYTCRWRYRKPLPS